MVAIYPRFLGALFFRFAPENTGEFCGEASRLSSEFVADFPTHVSLAPGFRLHRYAMSRNDDFLSWPFPDIDGGLHRQHGLVGFPRCTMTGVTFPAVWVGPGIPGVRNCDGTYCETPLDDLPLIEANDDLTWLKPLHPTIDAEMRPFRPSAIERQRYAQNVRTILAQADEQGIKLPRAFVELIQSEALQDHFPSPTACYFDLPESIARAPFGLDGHIIRFLNDSQTCAVWYLYVPTHETASVLVSAPVETSEEEVVYFLEELERHQDSTAIADAAAVTRFASRTFPEFLYRLWLEGSIWFKREHGIALSSEEAAYLGNA